MGALNPAYLGRFRGGSRKPLVFRASPGTPPANALFIRAPEATAQKRPIHAGLRAALLKTRQSIATRLCQKTRRRDADSTSSTARRSQRRILAKEAAISGTRGSLAEARAWLFERKRVIKPAARQPATRSFLRLGSRFFADFLWRDKERRWESQRGALPLSATASRNGS